MRFDVLVGRISQASQPVRLVAVDGCGGAGKSTFAARLSGWARLARWAGHCPVVPTDDFASWDEPLEWWPRLLQKVIEPLSAGRAATYRRYDWDRHTLGDPVTVEPAPMVVIEGVSASRSEWQDMLAFVVWVDAPRDVRLRRGLARDGAAARDLWVGWMAAEDGYVRQDRPAAVADLVVDGNPAIPHDPESEFVLATR